jgi:LuxR family maltose regulon positive regulatory protein
LLKRYRLAAGLSQEALAERAQMSVRGISDLERGIRRAPYKETLRQIINGLELTPEDRAELEAASQRFRVPSGRRQDEVATSLLETKLAPPPLASNLVARPRLVERVQRGIRGPLTLVTAPAGSGKTTLVREWRASAGGRAAPLAWVALDEGDNDVAVFWSYVCAALDRAVPGVARTALAMLHAPQAPSITPILTQLVNALAVSRDEVVLALDDYHVIESTQIHEELGFLLDHLPPSLHLLIASRADPPIPLSRMRARGQLTEIRLSDLRVTSDEALAFLGDVMQLALTREETHDLETRTEGWIAGLQLAALSLQGRSAEATKRFIASFSGSHRHVVDYLADEVLSRQPEPVQAFLLRTSILDRLNASLCAYVLGGEDTPDGDAASRQLLGDLERSNLFVVALDEERRWYRYHRLFRDALRNHMLQSPGHAVADLHERASDWYAEHDMTEEAISHALQGNAFTRAGELMEDMVWRHLGQGRVQTLRTWLDALPDPLLRTRPRLSAAAAFLSLAAAREDRAESILDDADVAAGTRDQDYRSVAGEILVIRASLAAARGDPAEVVRLGRRVPASLEHENPMLHGMMSFLLSSAYLADGDLALAARSFEVGAARARRTGNPFATLSAEVALSVVQRAQGKLRLAADTCRRALEWAATQDVGDLPAVGGLQVSLADVLREWNELDEALRYAVDGLAIHMKSDFAGFAELGYLGVARVRQAQGNLEQSLEQIREARSLATARTRRRGAVWSLALLGACEAQVWLAQGKVGQAVRWAQDAGSAQMPAPAVLPALVVYAQEHLTLAPLQIALAQARTSGDRGGLYSCLRQLEGRRSEAERLGAPWLQIKMLVLEALAFESLDDRRQAFTVLGQAVTLAEPEKYVRVFADEGPSLASLLRDLAEEHDSRAYIGKLLGAMPKT